MALAPLAAKRQQAIHPSGAQALPRPFPPACAAPRAALPLAAIAAARAQPLPPLTPGPVGAAGAKPGPDRLQPAPMLRAAAGTQPPSTARPQCPGPQQPAAAVPAAALAADATPPPQPCSQPGHRSSEERHAVASAATRAGGGGSQPGSEGKRGQPGPVGRDIRTLLGAGVPGASSGAAGPLGAPVSAAKRAIRRWCVRRLIVDMHVM